MTNTIIITLAAVSAFLVLDLIGAVLLIKYNSKVRNRLKVLLGNFMPSMSSPDVSSFITRSELESAAGQGQEVINQLQSQLNNMGDFVTKSELHSASGGSEALMEQLKAQLGDTFITGSQLEAAAGQGQEVINQLQSQLNNMDEYVTKAELQEASGGSEALMEQLQDQLGDTFVTKTLLESASQQGADELGKLKALITKLSGAIDENFSEIQGNIESAANEGGDVITHLNTQLAVLKGQLKQMQDGMAVLYNEVNEA